MGIGFNPNKFIKGSEESETYVINPAPDDILPAEKPKKKKPLTPKESTELAEQNRTTAPAVHAGIDFIQSNTPYIEAFRETNGQLDESITQLNMLGGSLMAELQEIKSSKTLRNKYGHINDMTETMATIINAKLSAIKEKNKVINDANAMEIRRAKELKASAEEKDDKQRIMNLYDAFVNTPIATKYNGLGPSFMDTTLANYNQGLEPTQVSEVSEQQQLMQWQSGLSPAENRMLLDAQGKIETVVFYDNATGNRWYDVVDKTTGQPIPNVEKPLNDNIYELDINIRGGFAKDTNRNETYRLVVLNGDADNILEY